MHSGLRMIPSLLRAALIPLCKSGVPAKAYVLFCERLWPILSQFIPRPIFSSILLANDHFAEMRSLLDVLVGGWGVVKGKHAVDHWMKLARGDGAIHREKVCTI